MNLIQFYSIHIEINHTNICLNQWFANLQTGSMLHPFPTRCSQHPLPHPTNTRENQVVVTYPAHHHAGWLFKDFFLCCSNVSSKQQDRHQGGTTVISFRERYQRSFSTPFQMRWSKGKRSKEIKELVSFKSGPSLVQGHLLVRLRATLRVAAAFKKLCGSTLD